MTSREELLNLADALEKADWAGVSIGNKMLLVGAIEALRAAPAQATREPAAWQARPPHSDWRRIAPEHVDDYRAKDWEVRPEPTAGDAQPAVKLPKTNEIRKLIEDFTAPDWDTKTAFASHRRAWIVQCLELALAASALPSTGLPAPAPHEEVREATIEECAAEANGIEPDILAGMNERDTSVYCRSRTDAVSAIRALALPQSTKSGDIEPHIYSPDYQAMGDCRVCGHVEDKPWHLFASADRAGK